MIRPDGILLTSILPAYINVATPTAVIAISGSITTGNTVNFSNSLAYSVADKNVMGDAYGANSVTGRKFLLNNLLVASSGVEYSPKSTELCQMKLSYSAGTLTATYSIFNGTGSTLTVITQNVTVSAPIYKLPF